MALWSLVVLFFALRFALDNPMATDARVESTDGVETTRDSRADILVVLDYEAIRQSGKSFPERDWSAAWIQIFEQEIGPVAIATPETLTETLLDSARVIILSASVSDSLPDPLIERARQHALSGGVLIVDRPEGRARELFSANGRGGSRSGRTITHAEGMEETRAASLRRMPLMIDYIGSTSPREGSTTLLSIDGAPVIYSIPFGDGRVITVDFDLTGQLVALRQGRPQDDFSVSSGDPRRPARTADLVAHEALLGSEVPFATLLERFVVFGVVMRYTPIPFYWYFPGGAKGAAIFAHEDSRLGDGGAWMLGYEQEHGGASTLLTTVDSGLTEGGAERIRHRGGEVGLAWRLPDPSVAVYETYGLGRFHLFREPVSLTDQLSALPSSPIRTARTLDGIWTHGWAEALSAMAASGVRSDLSYEVSTHRGYSFGSGLPTMALSDEGIPLGLRIYPVVASLRANQGPEIQDLLERSAAGDHQLVTFLTRPAYFADYPDMGDFDAWISVFSALEEHDHALMSLQRYDAFQRQRRASSLRSRYVSTPLPRDARQGAGSTNARALRVVAEGRERGMFLIVPEHVGGRRFVTARRGTERVGQDVVSSRVDTEPFEVMGFPLRRVSLEQGFNNLEFYYH